MSSDSQPVSPRRRAALWTDAALLVVVFAAGSLIGTRYVAAYQTVTFTTFGELGLGPAVSFACGRGFATPEAPPPALIEFLSHRTDTFSCAQLGTAPSTVAPTIMQRLYRYTMLAIAIQWRVFGISWSGLPPLFGVVFAATLCAAYGLFRLAAGPFAAAAAVVPLAISTHHLLELPGFRDYAKAPFMLVLVLLMAWLAIPPLRPRRSLALAIAFGVVLGIGFGFRNDLLINVPPFVLVVALLTPGRIRDNFSLKAACAGVAAIAFVISAWPILGAYSGGSNSGHVMVLGWMSAFDGPLGMTRPAYDLGPHYLDGFAATVIDGSSVMRTGRHVAYLSPEYDRTAAGLVAGMARHFPADVVARATSSTLQVLELPFTAGVHSSELRPDFWSPSVLRVYQVQSELLRWLTGLGVPLALLGLAVIGAQSVRTALVAACLVGFYCGYPAIQFHPRHFFHLEFLGWLSLLVVGVPAVASVRRLIRERRGPRLSWPALRRAAVVVAAVIVFATVPLATLRAYQQRHVTELISSYLKAARRPLETTTETNGGESLVRVPSLWKAASADLPVVPSYLALQFGAEGCAASSLPVTLKYSAVSDQNDYSYTRHIEISKAGPSTRIVPVYENEPYSRFEGVAMPAGFEGCLSSVSVITQPGELPLLLDFSLAPDWPARDLFQRVAAWESTPTGATLVLTSPASLAVPANETATTVLTADYVARGVSMTNGALPIAGRIVADGPARRYLRFAPTPVDAGARLFVRGNIHRGGLEVRLLEHDSWLGEPQVVTTTGPFVVGIEAPQAGEFGALVSDASPAFWHMESKSLLRRFAVRALPGLFLDDFELTEVAWYPRRE